MGGRQRGDDICWYSPDAPPGCGVGGQPAAKPFILRLAQDERLDGCVSGGGASFPAHLVIPGPLRHSRPTPTFPAHPDIPGASRHSRRIPTFPPHPDIPGASRHSRRIPTFPPAIPTFPPAIPTFPPPSRHSRRHPVIPAPAPSFPRKRESTPRPSAPGVIPGLVAGRRVGVRWCWFGGGGRILRGCAAGRPHTARGCAGPGWGRAGGSGRGSATG